MICSVQIVNYNLKMNEIDRKFVHYKFKIGISKIERTLFVKQHDGSDIIKPNDRTLFVVNIPQFLTKKYLKELFLRCGPIETVYIQSKPSNGVIDEGSKYFPRQTNVLGPKVGYIIFKRTISLQKALNSNKAVVLSKDAANKSGKRKWSEDYNSHFIDVKRLNEEIGNFMGEFDKKIEEEKVKVKKIDGIADDEGWVTVSKQSKKPKILRNENTSQKLIAKQKQAQAKLSLINFYKCQIRNAKMDEIIELRKKFDNDKKRLALMKAGRKFKPV